MIDSHCHLDSCADPAAAADPALLALVTVGTTPERNDIAIGLAAEFANVWAAVGIHPNDAGLAADAGARERLAEQMHAPRVVGIGETGFDTHWDSTTLAEQQIAFDFQAGLAAECGKPLILHVRDRQGGRTASAAACRALRAAGLRGGILHCFNGDPELLETGLALGWFVSFAGTVTFPKATAVHEAARAAPADRLLVETDSPYLAPVPHRGKRNTPAYVRHTCARLAELRGTDVDTMERLTDDNALRAFGLPLARHGGEALS